MTRDILSDFGEGSSQLQAARARSGGVLQSKDVMRYSPPVGPHGINDPKRPGIAGGVNSGTDQQPTRLQEGGQPGILAGGFNHGNKGCQGRY